MGFSRFSYIYIGESNSSHYIKTNINIMENIVTFTLNADYNILGKRKG